MRAFGALVKKDIYAIQASVEPRYESFPRVGCLHEQAYLGTDSSMQRAGILRADAKGNIYAIHASGHVLSNVEGWTKLPSPRESTLHNTLSTAT